MSDGVVYKKHFSKTQSQGRNIHERRPIQLFSNLLIYLTPAMTTPSNISSTRSIKMAQTPQPYHLDPLNRGPTLRRSASVPSLHPEVLDHDTNSLTAEDHIATLEHLERLHYNEVGVLQANLYSRSEELRIIQSKHEEECAARKAALELAEKKEKSRKKNARARAQQRDTAIVSLEEELEHKNQLIRALEEYAATAAKFIENTQDDIQHLIFQLDNMRHQKEQLADRASCLSRANTELRKKNIAVKKERERFKQEMDVKKRDLMDAVDREIRRSGTALIQRDTERARCRQYEEGRIPLNSSTAIRDDKIMRLVMNGPPASETENMSAGFMQRRSRGKMTSEMRATIFEEHNRTLIATVEAMQTQKGQDEEEKEQLRRLNHQNIVTIHELRLAIEQLCANNGWSLDQLTEAQPNE